MGPQPVSAGSRPVSVQFQPKIAGDRRRLFWCLLLAMTLVLVKVMSSSAILRPARRQ